MLQYDVFSDALQAGLALQIKVCTCVAIPAWSVPGTHKEGCPLIRQCRVIMSFKSTQKMSLHRKGPTFQPRRSAQKPLSLHYTLLGVQPQQPAHTQLPHLKSHEHGMPHVQSPSHVRWRHCNDERLGVLLQIRLKVAFRFPPEKDPHITILSRLRKIQSHPNPPNKCLNSTHSGSRQIDFKQL